jgi:large subunit ribosomal protein L23
LRIINVKGKKKTLGRFEGKRKDWKKVIVTLQKEFKIELFEGA